MTRFVRDMEKIKTTDGIMILKERKAEIEALCKRLNATRNSFVANCIQQELTKRRNEYKILSDLVF